MASAKNDFFNLFRIEAVIGIYLRHCPSDVVIRRAEEDEIWGEMGDLVSVVWTPTLTEELGRIPNGAEKLGEETPVRIPGLFFLGGGGRFWEMRTRESWRILEFECQNSGELILSPEGFGILFSA